MSKIKHVLGISGGKDSAALAIYMRDNHPELDIEYFFTDTGKELDQVYEYLGTMEAYLGKPIKSLNEDKGFDYWLNAHNGYLPAAQARWCTVKMKLKPFEDWIQSYLDDGYEVYSYVGIRADEPYRTAFTANDSNLHIKLPFREDGIDKPTVLKILEDSGVGLPAYYEWRTRSGCTFCFFQRKIEWVGLLERHPESFKEAMAYETAAIANGTPFTWSERESLEQLARPERILEIKAAHDKRVEKYKQRLKITNLTSEGKIQQFDHDDIYTSSDVCLMCHK